mmetsp:Transcript_1821/g.4050  ORF Transcript_1821/g.4050 Transcript_1821/m.4050 type:complete len:269 (+) Transcript_1821:3036-3842(+)
MRGVAPPTLATGVSSHLERTFFSPPTTGVAPGSRRPGVGVSSQRLRREAPAAVTGVGASQRPGVTPPAFASSASQPPEGTRGVAPSATRVVAAESSERASDPGPSSHLRRLVPEASSAPSSPRLPPSLSAFSCSIFFWTWRMTRSRSFASSDSLMMSLKVRTRASGVWSPAAKGSWRSGEMMRLRRRMLYSLSLSETREALCASIGSTPSPSFSFSANAEAGAVKDWRVPPAPAFGIMARSAAAASASSSSAVVAMESAYSDRSIPPP